MSVTAVSPGHEAGTALGMSGRLWEAYENYLWHHRIEGHTEDTVKFYAKELRLFLQDLDPSCKFLGELSPLHVLAHLGSMKERGRKPRTISSRWQAITTWLNWCVEYGLIESSPKCPRSESPFLPKNSSTCC